MNRFFLLLLLVSLKSICYAQSRCLDCSNNYYVHTTRRQSTDYHFEETHYDFYDTTKYDSVAFSTQKPLFNCNWVEYDRCSVGGERKILIANLEYGQNQKEYCLNLNRMLSYIAARKHIDGLTEIVLGIPIELSVSISSKIEQEIGHLMKTNSKKIDGFKKKGKIHRQENEIIKRELKCSSFFVQLSTILAKYKMEINEIQIVEPTLFYSKRNFIESFTQYKNYPLPQFVLGLNICLILRN